MTIKIISHYLLDLVYSLLTYFIFARELIVGYKTDRFWQNENHNFDDELRWQPGLVTFAPVLVTGLTTQCVFTNVVVLSHDFWALLMAMCDWIVMSRVMACQNVVIKWVNMGFRLGAVWFGRPPREPLDRPTRS